MSLFGLIDYEGTSSSSSESDEETPTEGSSAYKLGKNLAIDGEEDGEKLVLPSPLLGPSEPSSSKEFSTRTFQRSSIFYNPFKAEEKRKLDVLEKHVHLTKSVPSSKNNKRICYKFQKGKCRFGDNCRFAHATNIIKPEAVNEDNDAKKVAGDDVHINRTEIPYNPENDGDEWEEAKPKKRRVGVTDSLVPPKKAMKAYEQQKSREKPWKN
ncbi:uncharacterized protein LOC116287292 [Actinia tenebrosa]|uniref:Uncharacterized protein LOC116287292 n=1 Tax=Actinia tenebrosa TaxID=6105 RepID=A0A6P8H2J2_ACTTE|nr:uncharacterized protein LOC116287292 [Actinia tenebrosa]